MLLSNCLFSVSFLKPVVHGKCVVAETLEDLIGSYSVWGAPVLKRTVIEQLKIQSSTIGQVEEPWHCRGEGWIQCLRRKDVRPPKHPGSHYHSHLLYRAKMWKGKKWKYFTLHCSSPPKTATVLLARWTTRPSCPTHPVGQLTWFGKIDIFKLSIFYKQWYVAGPCQ